MLRYLLIAILLLLIVRAFWKVIDHVIAAASGPAGERKPGAASVRLVRDPVCGTHVLPADSLSLTAAGRTHYFCSEQCRSQFQRTSA